ncbi:receptor-like protein 12 [Tanacetum coccineum]|uniref:Receptor-like protein 12 n=1 Tax=Tanacetum coccineum TaxID=301880 RepID=A0ABQ5ABU6_9ASTR
MSFSCKSCGVFIYQETQILAALQSLVISKTNFSGGIPESIGNLDKLSRIELQQNNFAGPIPESMKRLTQPPMSFLELGQLSVLLLSSNNLSGVIETKDFQGLDNKIQGKIPNWIWEFGDGHLTSINLSHNELTDLEEPYTFRTLVVLDLHSNRLSGVIHVPPITAIYIDYSNNLLNLSLSEIHWRDFLFLTFFSVSNNLLAETIPKTICNAKTLYVVDLSNNRLTGRIPQCLIEFGYDLGVLNLASNRLNGQIEGTFPATCSLNTLDLHGNSLAGEIPRSVVNCTMLEVLNLRNNKIYDTYPCFLGTVTNLHVLVLRSNRLHGSVHCGRRQYNWSNLQILDIAHNDFNGVLPPEFFSQWGGVIPETIGQLKALYLLNVSHNEFMGSIPPSLGHLSHLESLDMSSNKITGEIPSVLTTLPFLSTLNLSYNQLKGRIPTGNQFQTFENNSYLGNKGLCGFPLNITCTSPILPVPKLAPKSQEAKKGYDWQSIFYGMGVGAGSLIVISVLYSLCKGNTCSPARQTNSSR